MNLNFDMVGSPNYVSFVYDGDGSDTRRPPGRSARTRSRRCSSTTSTAQAPADEPTAFDGRSDYGPFIAVGIPAGGLFTGAEGIKTAEEAAIFGGTAGVAYDPCYHQACDDIDNNSNEALRIMSNAIAHAVMTAAMSREPVNARMAARSAAAGVQTDYRGNKLVR